MSENVLNFKVSRIHKMDNASHMKAFIDLSINDQVLIKGVKVIEGQKGLFVSMPQEKGKDNKWYDTIRCLTNETRSAIAKEVLAAYSSDS